MTQGSPESTWTVVERLAEGKSPSAPCEDVIVDGPRYFAVIDGATDETGVSFGGTTGGRFAADRIADAIATVPPEADAVRFAEHLSRALRRAVTETHGRLGDDDRWPSASVACFVSHREEVWRIGDCHVVVDGTVHRGTKRVDDASYGFRAVINAALLARGTTLDELIERDPGMEASILLHSLQQHLANRPGPWGYGCINGRDVPREFIEVIDTRGAGEIVLASDGFPEPLPTLELAEQELRRLLAEDPGAIGELWSIGKPLKPGNRAPDDRCYLRVGRR